MKKIKMKIPFYFSICKSKKNSRKIKSCMDFSLFKYMFKFFTYCHLLIVQCINCVLFKLFLYFSSIFTELKSIYVLNQIILHYFILSFHLLFVDLSVIRLIFMCWMERWIGEVVEKRWLVLIAALGSLRRAVGWF